MSWQITSDLDEYAGAAGAFLHQQPVMHTVQLTVLARLRAAGRVGAGDAAPLFGWWRSPAGMVATTFLHTQPRPLLLDAAPEGAADSLADVLADRRWQLPGVNSDPATAKRFANAWRRRTGATVVIHRHQRLYRLARLVGPTPAPPGQRRLADATDRNLLLTWNRSFQREVGETPGDVASFVDDRLGYGGYTLWEVDGTPVSLAGLTRRVAGMVRVAPVYTPPEHRRRGYAGAVTAEVSRAAMNAGAREVLLFTDVANATSNSLYQRLGFRPIANQLVLAFVTNGLVDRKEVRN
jgi:ribosomal protein S18 acetylase RimI-like enzyme